MPGLRPPDDEPIRVAAPRPQKGQRAPKRRAVDATGAGLTLIVIIALGAAIGAYAGRQVGATISGAILGGFAGLLAGFAAIYLRYRDL